MKSKDKSKNINLVFLFFGVVFLIILSSFIYKLFLVVKNSKFDGSNNYVLAYMKSNESDIVSFSPSANSISILKIKGNFKGKIVSLVKVPVDGYVYGEKNLEKQNVPGFIDSAFFMDRNSLNYVDLFRLSIFARGVPKQNVNRDQVNSSDWNKIEELAQSLFSDPKIVSEKESVEIVNSAGVYGLGNSFAQILGNIGGDVVLVSTGNDRNDSSITYFGEKTYSVKRYSQILGVEPVQSKDRGISDIIITIGKDKAQNY